ncbi:MAG TPA: lipopolysaccharide heptosyltransferase II [Candidatus Binataceae bacterium]|nr:lipopolysaccharide heptosyltransferase II [Candidatus Binataceae bacterium]
MDEVSPTPTSPHRPAPRALEIVPQRILVKEVNWLGDLVMSLPALRAVRAAFPAARLAVLVRENLAGFFDGIDWINETITYRDASGLRVLRRNWHVVRGIRARSFDLAILFPNSFESALWMTLARIPNRAGYATGGRRPLLTHRATPAPDALGGHQAGYWLGMVRDTLGAQTSAETTGEQLEPSRDNLARIRAWLDTQRGRHVGALVAIAPIAAYGAAKEWPSARYVELINRLQEVHGARCVIVGAASERTRCEQLAAVARGGAIVAAGALSLGEQIALLSLCDGFAGNDSGAMHLAAALGIATVGIFGSTNPARTGPLGPRARFILHPPPCSPCLARTCRFGHYDCLHAITASEVAATLVQLGAFDHPEI